jgi:hypothetical protein
MSRVVLLLLAAALVAASASAAGREAADAKPRLSVEALRPLVVAGTGFRAGEIVRVTASADEGFGAKSAEVGNGGRISARFPKLKLGRCSDYVVSAKGNKGSRATLRSVPRPCGIDR